MGKVIIEYDNGRLESFKCKSKIRAKEIAKARPSAIKWNYYGRNDIIPQVRKKKAQKKEATIEETEGIYTNRRAGSFGLHK